MLDKIKPLNDYILIKRKSSENKSSGGILIPEGKSEKPLEGDVIAVHDGYYENGQQIKSKVSVSQKVLFPKHAGQEVKVEQQEYLLIKEKEILAIINC